MPESSRARILERLAAASVGRAFPASDFGVLARKRWPPSERYPRLRRLMEAVKAEFLETTEEGWAGDLYEFVKSQGLSNLLYGPGTPEAGRLEQAWGKEGSPRLLAYDRPADEWKRSLFEDIDAGFTTTRGGIAETGGLIVWPSEAEPRLLSLVAPVHIALLRASEIYDTFWEALAVQRWSEAMPPNALLVSGPSKTADIEQTLAYGVHGPKRLVVVAVRSEADRP